MYCTKCGSKYDGTPNYCPGCGEPLHEKKESSREKNQALAPFVQKCKSIPLKFWLIGLGVILVVVVGSIVFINAKKTISLNQYVKVSFSGYESYGTASISIDWEQLEEDHGKDVSFTKKAENTYGSFLSLMSPVDLLKEEVQVSLEKAENLTNGEAVSYTWTIDEESLKEYLNCKLKYTDGTVTVADLEAVETFYPFEDLTVSFTGVEPYGEVELEYTGEELSLYDFNCTSQSGLSEGDEVTISLSGTDKAAYAKQYGAIPDCTEKTYTVKGLSRYVSELDQITDDVKEEMQKQAEDVVTSYIADLSSDVQVKNVKLVGDYLMVAKDSTMYQKNKYGMVFQMDVSVQAKEDYETVEFTQYYYVAIRDLLVHADGSCEVNVLDYEQSSNTFYQEVKNGPNSYNYKNYWFKGYESLTELKKQTVDLQAGSYSSIWNVTEETK